MASSLGWSIELKVFLKSMYVMCMSLFVNLLFSNAAMMVCIWRTVFLMGRKTF